jgi:hypothetical protein
VVERFNFAVPLFIGLSEFVLMLPVSARRPSPGALGAAQLVQADRVPDWIGIVTYIAVAIAIVALAIPRCIDKSGLPSR